MKLLFQFLSKWGSLLLLLCLFLLFNILLSSFLPKEYALDLMFAYTADEAYAAIGHLDSNQREIYFTGIWVLDMPYMVIYCLLFSGLIIKVWKNNRAALLPLAVGVMDLFENLVILRILELYPVQNEILVNTASFFTTAKWLLVGVLLLTLVVGLFSILNSRRYSVFNSTGARI